MILLTGATGFIGKHIYERLLQIYGEEKVVVLTSDDAFPGRHLLHNNYSFDGDIFVDSGFSNIDTIIHAGAFIPKDSGEADLIYESNTNICNTYQLLESNLPNLHKFIFLSTIDVYCSNNDIITENSLVNPVSMYGYSKLYCEEMIKKWARQNNITAQLLRIGHVYGPGEESYKKLMPVMIDKVIRGENVTIFGSGEAKRSFIFIKDVVDAILKSLELDKFVGPINIANDNSLTINNVVEMIVSLSGGSVQIHRKNNSAKTRDLVFDITKMGKYLVKPKIAFDEGLKIEFDYVKSIRK